MSAATVAALLSDLIEPPCDVPALVPTAKAANPANRELPCGVQVDAVRCESLRIRANGQWPTLDVEPDSQRFAAIRNVKNAMESEQRRGSSQDSQNSQVSLTTREAAEAIDLAAVAWTGADIAAFIDRRARLLRWGWTEPEAERLADRLVRRDREQDERVSCIDCRHYRPGHCGNRRQAGLNVPDMGRALAMTLQRCQGFAMAAGPTLNRGGERVTPLSLP